MTDLDLQEALITEVKEVLEHQSIKKAGWRNMERLQCIQAGQTI